MSKDRDALILSGFIMALAAMIILLTQFAPAQFEIGDVAEPVQPSEQGVQVDIDALETPPLAETGNLAQARNRVVIAIHLLAAKPVNRERLDLAAAEFFEGAIADQTVQQSIAQAIQAGVLTQAQAGVVTGALRGMPETINNRGCLEQIDELIRALRFATWEEAFGIPDANLGGEPTQATRTALIQTLVAYADAVIQTAAATLPSESLTVDMGFEE